MPVLVVRVRTHPAQFYVSERLFCWKMWNATACPASIPNMFSLLYISSYSCSYSELSSNKTNCKRLRHFGVPVDVQLNQGATSTDTEQPLQQAWGERNIKA